MRPNKTLRTIGSIFIAIVFSLAVFHSGASAQSTAFSFQGLLNDGPSEANGNYDFEFRLYDSLSGGNEIGSVNARSAVTVEDGAFAVTLDFGAGFPGAERFLEIRVRPAGGASFTTLDPRQKVDSSPYAMQSLNAANAANAQNAVNAQNALSADTAVNAQNAVNAANATTAANALGLGGIAADQFVVTTDPRLSDSRQPAPGSGSYIQNGTESQAGANFNISGNGTAAGTLTASVVNVTTQYNAGNSRLLTALNSIGTTIVGIGAGATLPNSTSTSPLGAPTPGQDSSFFGARSGNSNTTGYRNSYFGYESGLRNTTGQNNAFFGSVSGETNSTGSSNSFFGSAAGFGTTTGSLNTFVGLISGVNNLGGNNNTIVGAQAGFSSSSSGSSNILLGWNSRVASGINNAGAIGARAMVTSSDSLVLGGINGVNGATTDTNVGIGTTSPLERLHVVGKGIFTGGMTVLGTFTANLNAANITTGVVSATKGGTGLSASGAAGNFLRSNGTAWTSARIGAGDLPSGSSLYIQNRTTQQAATNFNIGGVGTAQAFNASEYQIDGSRVLSITSQNTYVGLDAGINTTGGNNAFFGRWAGRSNTTGSSNSFFGWGAGSSNATGINNSFFGSGTGITAKGSGNSIFGANASVASSTADDNSFFGTFSGNNNATGARNTFLGNSTGVKNTSGSENVFIGTRAGFENTIGSGITLVGGFAEVGTNNLGNAAAIGHRAFVTQNNSLILGGINGINGATADTRVGIGTTAPTNLLTVTGPGSTVGGTGGFAEVVGKFQRNVVGAHTAISVDAMPDQDAIVYLAKGGSALWHLRNDASDGDKFQIRSQSTTRFNIDLTGNVGIGTTTPTELLHVNGRIRVATLGSANTTTVLCRNTAQQIATCNSSSRRYKFNIQDFGSGLELIRRLRPVAYNWIAGGARDVGLVAEEVAVAEPLLATYNDNGEVEGVKYDRVGVVVINAVTEQQAMIEDQRKTIAAQQDRIEKLEQQAKIMREALCRLTADPGICGMK